MISVSWIGRYRYTLNQIETGTVYSFENAKTQAENHAKVLELLLKTQETVDYLRLQLFEARKIKG